MSTQQQFPEYSINGLPGRLSSFVRDPNSVYGLVDPYMDNEFAVPPPQHTDMRLLENSINGLPAPGVDSNRAWHETDGGGPTLSDLVRDPNSVYGLVDPYMDDEFVIPPPERTAVRLLEQSAYGLPAPDVDGNVARHESDGGGPTLSGLGPVDFAKRGQTNTGSSTNIRGLKPEKTLKQMGFYEIETIPETTTIYKARCQLQEGRGFLVVTNSYALPSGTLSEEDIVLRVNAPEIEYDYIPVSKVMRKNSIFLSPDTLCVEALQKMLEGKVIGLPVVENDKVIGLAGLVSCYHNILETTGTTVENYHVLGAAVKFFNKQQMERQGEMLEFLKEHGEDT